MKITVIGPVPPYKGGISEFTVCIIEELRKKHDVQVLSWKKQYPRFAVKENKDSNVLPYPGAQFVLHYGNPLTWNKASSLIKQFGSEMVIIPWLTPLAAPTFVPLLNLIKSRTKAQIVAVCHNATPHEKSLLDSFFSKQFFNVIDKAMVHTEEDYTTVLSLNNKLKVVKGFHPLYENYPKGKTPALLKNIKNYLLFFGFVRPYKGLHYLLQSLPLVLKQKKIKLLIVGEFWEDKQIYEQEITQLGIQDAVVIQSSYVPKEEVAAYFQKADAVVLPYIAGSQSGIIQLAYNFDKPVICTDVGGFKEVVLEGKTGYVVQPKNAQALAQAILTFYKTKKDFKTTIQKEKKKYTWETYCQLLLN